MAKASALAASPHSGKGRSFVKAIFEGRRTRRSGVVLTVGLSAFALASCQQNENPNEKAINQGFGQTAKASHTGGTPAIIQSGNVQLGVNNSGNLNVPG